MTFNDNLEKDKERVQLKVYDAERMLRGCCTTLDMMDMNLEADKLKKAVEGLRDVLKDLDT